MEKLYRRMPGHTLTLLLFCSALSAQTTRAGVWRTTAPAPEIHLSQTATLLTNGQVLIVGGALGGYFFGELFDPATGNWSLSGSLTSPRVNHTATLLTNGMVLVTGGHATNAISSTELFLPGPNTWVTNAPMNQARTVHTATRLPDGRVLVVGGSSINDTLRAELADAELFDPETGIWTTTGPLHNSRMAHTATLLPNGKVLVTGGVQTNTGLTSCELYDPVTGNWQPTGSMGSRRIFHTATLLNNGQVLVTGGSVTSSPTNVLSEAELYDPNSELWYPVQPMANARFGHTATPLSNGKVLIVGGFQAYLQIPATSEIYDPTTQSWEQEAPITEARHLHAASLLPDGRVLIVGGKNASPFPFVFSTECYSVTFPIQLEQPSTLANGTFQFTFTNAPTVGFNVFASTNFIQPIANWTLLGTATQTAPGQFQFADTQATNYPQRFYRVSAY